jgi:hypothetical protein
MEYLARVTHAEVNSDWLASMALAIKPDPVGGTGRIVKYKS